MSQMQECVQPACRSSLIAFQRRAAPPLPCFRAVRVGEGCSGDPVCRACGTGSCLYVGGLHAASLFSFLAMRHHVL